MEGASHKHPKSAESGSVVKPVPLYHYVDQFERLYQQSPMAKMFRQELMASPKAKGLAPEDGRSRNSMTVKTFKLPLAPSLPSPASNPRQDPSKSIPAGSVELNVRTGTGVPLEPGHRRHPEQRSMGTYEAILTVAGSSASDASPDPRGITETKMVSPPPRLQGLPRQSEDVRKRKIPNLHNLIQRLASPAKWEVAPAPEMHPRSGEAKNRSGGGSSDGLHRGSRDATLSGGQDQTEVDPSEVLLVTPSGASKRTIHANSGPQLDEESLSVVSPNDAPIPGSSSANKRKRLPQRRTLRSHNKASNPDHIHQPPNALDLTSPCIAEPVSTLPKPELTPRSTPAADAFDAGPPKSPEHVPSDETPVIRRPGGRHARSIRSQVDVGGLIRSLQVQPGLEAHRLEEPYTSTVNKNSQEDLGDPPMDHVGPEALENGHEDDEERGIQEDEPLASESQDTDDTMAGTASKRDRNETGDEAKVLADRRTKEKPSRQSVQNKLDVDLPTEMLKKSETIINRWIIKPVPPCRGVCVEGHRVGDKGDQFWHSTAIMVRTTPRLVATKSGSLYRLAGKMDLALSMEQGFSESLVRCFQKGFPTNWRDLLHDFYTVEEKRNVAVKTSKSASKKDRFVSPIPSRTDLAVTESAQKPKKKTTVEVTPQSLRIKDLHRSSSGRLIKPPLAYWTGQRIRHNTSLDFVEILMGTEDHTSASADQVSLQDSLELEPREKRAMSRAAKANRRTVATAERKHKPHSSKGDSDREEDSSSCPEPDTETEEGDSRNPPEKGRLSKRLKAQCHKEIQRGTAQRTKRHPSTIGDSADSAGIPGNRALRSRREDANDTTTVSKPRGKAKYQRKKLRQGTSEEGRMERGAAESCSSGPPGVVAAGLVTDDSVSTSSTNPVGESKEEESFSERVVVHVSSQARRSRQPSPPQKVRARKEVGGTSKVYQSRAPASPLYYQFSPASEGEGSHTVQYLKVDKTPLAAVRKATSVLGPSSGGSATEMTNSEGEGKLSSAKDGLRSSDGTLNLQEEILAVVEKHKQGRIARMRQRSLKLAASSKDKSRERNLSSTSDVYDLSDDEAETSPKRIPFRLPGGTTTTGESVSNWSEEGDKTVNQTWVTRGGPHRRVYGDLEDRRYRSEERSTETLTSTTENEVPAVNPVSSDRESTLTESSENEAFFKLHRISRKKSVSGRLKGARTRQVPDPDLAQVDEGEQTQRNRVASRGRQRAEVQTAAPGASSEDTDDTLGSRDKPAAAAVQRHQPMRRCKRSGSDSEMHSPPRTTPDAVAKARPRSTEPHQCASSEQLRQSTAPRRSIGEAEDTSTSKCQAAPGTVHQGVRWRNSLGLDGEEGQVLVTSRRLENGDADVRNPGVRQKEGDKHPLSSTMLGGTKPTKQLTKQQENHAQAAVVLTAKVGTMKRKRQLRDLVEQHNRGYEDDIFDSTPFKKQKKLKIPLGEWDTEEDSQDSQAGKTPGSARFKTPSVRYQGLLPLSDKKTPYSNLISPGLLPTVDRRHIDQYIHGLQKRKKGCGLAQRPGLAKKTASFIREPAKSNSATLTKAMRDRVTDVFDVTPASDSDPDEDRDYYWSDEEH